MFHLDKVKYWFKLDNLGITNPVVWGPENIKQGGSWDLEKQGDPCLSQRTLMTENDWLIEHPVSLQLTEALPHYLVKDQMLYNQNQIKVPEHELIIGCILEIRDNNKLDDHPGQAKTLSPLSCSFTWPSLSTYVVRYIDGFNSCQHVESFNQKLFVKLKPLPIPSGPWTDIIHDLITGLPVSNRFDSILTVIGWLTRMDHLL